jgi:flagellar basal body rod protein FlgG
MTNSIQTGNLSSAFYAGVQGYNQGAEQVREATIDLSTANNPNRERPVNINQNAVELISGNLQAEASAKVIRSADEMLGTIIDTYA